MSGYALSVQNLVKEFRFFQDRPSDFKTYLVRLFRGKIGFGDFKKVSVLEGVSFDILPGEFVGIMGANGVGKSTLLKLISGIYTPTSGSIRVNGQIAPMIELGAGFHPELSGYENIFLNGAILGFGRKAILEKVSEIHEFSELGEKLYTPTKNFSSGMLARLGFSIVTHLPAPILLIDEILAVGDIGFQEKSLRKIRALHAEGRTLILISHDPEDIRKNCSRCIVLADKRKIYDGSAEGGAETYRNLFKG
jgi:ABC-type polysaccharide/polyol phosphate transport system ATPase subunit